MTHYDTRPNKRQARSVAELVETADKYVLTITGNRKAYVDELRAVLEEKAAIREKRIIRSAKAIATVDTRPTEEQRAYPDIVAEINQLATVSGSHIPRKVLEEREGRLAELFAIRQKRENDSARALIGKISQFDTRPWLFQEEVDDHIAKYKQQLVDSGESLEMWTVEIERACAKARELVEVRNKRAEKYATMCEWFDNWSSGGSDSYYREHLSTSVQPLLQPLTSMNVL